MKEIKPIYPVMVFWIVVLLIYLNDLFMDILTFDEMFKIIVVGFVLSLFTLFLFHIIINPLIREKQKSNH